MKYTKHIACKKVFFENCPSELLEALLRLSIWKTARAGDVFEIREPLGGVGRVTAEACCSCS